jgi:hypothetical protein
MRTAVKAKYGDDVALKTVSSFFFLRFVSPAVLYPGTCGILEPLQHPSTNAQRGLVLAGKILQNLANGVSGQEYSEAHLTKINKVLVSNSGPMNTFMEKLCQKPEPADIRDECFPPSMQQYKTAISELQKYITGKIGNIPKKVRNEDAQESEPMIRLIKLRRALQSYSNTWQTTNRSTATKLQPPPTPTSTNHLYSVSMSGSMLESSVGSNESCGSELSMNSCRCEH